jgi:hypothetical protein
MESNDRLIDIIEDYESVKQFIIAMHSAIVSGNDMPNFVPVMNDSLMTDFLGEISQTITQLRRKLI